MSGYGVAVANAVMNLRAEADWVTPSGPGRGVVELIERMIAERAMRFDLFATLARREGGWKIVCMSLPE